MVIAAVIDRFENGNAILLAEELRVEISISEEEIREIYKEGETVYLTLEEGLFSPKK
ncbi:MAG TPA: hypothetical protein GX527_06155 [Clostridiaceae bacterium]|jgi:hypothetical protein|nr:hypothetical protein [Clostridiaceae bacterium]